MFILHKIFITSTILMFPCSKFIVYPILIVLISRATMTDTISTSTGLLLSGNDMTVLGI